MSLIVKGMSVPSECSECLFSCYDVSVCTPAECIILGERSARYYRPKICPLVEIPTTHGRLIDADVLIKDLQGLRELFPSKNIDYFGGVISLVKNSPTIIEAEAVRE